MEYLLRYPLDLTGTNPDNLIKNERHVLKDMRFRAIAPYYGSFFGDSVTIYDTDRQRTLIRNKDYVTAEILVDKTSLTGKPVNGVLLVINREVSKNVTITYQCLGGDNFRNNQSIENLLKVEHDDNEVSYSFLDINKKPVNFKPIFHLHNVAEIYGFEFLVYLLESLRNAVIWKKLDFCRDLINRIDLELNSIIESTVNISDEALDQFLTDFKNAFRKETFGLNKIKNITTTTQGDGIAIANGDRINLSHEAYVTLQTVSFYKEELYSLLVSKSKTNIGAEYGIVGIPTKEYLASASNGSRFFIDSRDVSNAMSLESDPTVFPDLTARRTKFSIYKVSNHVTGRGGLFMATNLITAATYVGKLTEYGANLLMEWKLLQTTSITDSTLAELVNHLGDQTNPHRDTKEDVELELLENLPVATKEDVLAQLSVRKYLTAENMQLFMKGFMAGQTDNNDTKPDPNINVMKRFDVVFSNCGDNLVSSGSGVCNIEEVDFSFNVFTQRFKYRNARRISEDPTLKDYNPVIYEAFTKVTGVTLTTDYSTRSGIKLVNIPKALNSNQTWNFGTLYQGFRSGVFSYETTDPYYDTMLVVRGAKTRPTLNGALELRFIKSYEELLSELGSSQNVADEYEFQMKKGDYLLVFRAFTKPTEGATEQAILDFEKREQVAKINIFSTGYTFYVDLRTAVYENYNFITLTEKNSPKVIPSIHYPSTPDNWFTNRVNPEGNGLQSSVIIGKTRLAGVALDIEPDPDNGINTLIENFRDVPRRPGYVNGTLGMTVVKLNNDGSTAVDYPIPVDDLGRDSFYNGILGITIENNKAIAVFDEQLDLVKSINYNVYLDPFIDATKVTRPIPYNDFKFSNPYASGNNSVGDTKFDAYLDHMRLGFNRVNALDAVSDRLNSSKGTLRLTIKNPSNPTEEFTIDITENVRLNRDLFNALYVNYINNPARKKYWGQPSTTLPYTELLEIPKRAVNQYKQQYYITEVDGQRVLEKAGTNSPENIEVDIIEVGRLESEYILAGQETVQYNALFNNVAILKKWRFVNIKPVINIDTYVAGDRYPVYPDFNVDRTAAYNEKDVTVFGVIDVDFSNELKYTDGLYGALSFIATAVNDLSRREITITLPEDSYDNIISEISASVDYDDSYQISEDGFSTFNIMFGTYDVTNHLTFDRDTKTITINMVHVGADQQSIFFNHHLKYIKWEFKIELAPTIITTVLYPVVYQDIMKTSAAFVNVKYNNFARWFAFEDKAKTDFVFDYVSVRKMLHEIYFEDKIQTDFEFVNARVMRVIGYRTTTAQDYMTAKAGFVKVDFLKVVEYVVYRNYVPELMRSKFELVNVNIKTVRIP